MQVKQLNAVVDIILVYIQSNPTSRVGTKISMIHINDFYHDSIMIFSSENIMIFLIFSISIFIIISYLLF